MMLSKVERLNKRAGYPKFKADEILRALSLARGTVLADIGSGGGYFTLRFAEAIGPEGIVYAVDTNAEFLAFVKKNAAQKGLANIQTVLSDEKGLKLPDHSCDCIFLRNVFHHLKGRIEYFIRIKPFLKPSGRVVIIDYRKRMSLNFYTIMGHCVDEGVIRKTMEDAGYRLVDRYDFLSEQSFTVYQVQ
jgi:ubiquinone/menaquinone biosynthesis C-methylase UbiE